MTQYLHRLLVITSALSQVNLGEEVTASYLYQVYHYWLETNDYGRFLADDDL